MAEDLSVDGPGSPISLRKFIDSTEGTLRDLTVLIDGTGMGIDVDDAPVLTITAADCAMQAEYFRETFFDENRLPKYIFDDFLIFYKTETADLAQEDQVKFVSNLIKYLQSEAKQILGMIILVRGSLSAAAKKCSSLRIYIEHPETHLHPKRQSAFMSWLSPIIDPLGSVKPTKLEDL